MPGIELATDLAAMVRFFGAGRLIGSGSSLSTGMLHAPLGATRADVARAFLIEYGLLGLITAAVAAVIGSAAAYLVLTAVMEPPFAFLPWAVASTALLATAITLALGFAGTWRALAQKAAPVLRNE